jgi:hypothetical protein
MRRRVLALLAFVFALGAAVAVAEDTVIEVLPVRNRPAADLVPALQTALGADVTVTSFNNRLIVNAPRPRMAEIRRLVAQLDEPARSLWITVRQDRTVQASDRAVEAGVTVGPGGAAVRGRAVREDSAGQSEDHQRLRALEGTPAFIAVGEAVPVPATVITPTPGGAAVVSGTTHHQADRGFWVVARVAGEVVTLEIETALDETRPGGAIGTQGIRTTVSGQLGEWISLGELGHEAAGRSSGILSANQAQRSELRTVQVKVEEQVAE